MVEKINKKNGFPPLGIHILMGDNAKEKIKNSHINLKSGSIKPYEIIAKKN